jgi:N utilization substance protein B
VRLRRETRVRARTLQVLYALEIVGDHDIAAAVSGVVKLTGDVDVVVTGAEPNVERICREQRELDAIAARAADNWRVERIAVIERNILRIAIDELRHHETPVRVVIDEALWLAHRFAGARAPGFINGILDRIARDMGRL